MLNAKELPSPTEFGQQVARIDAQDLELSKRALADGYRADDVRNLLAMTRSMAKGPEYRAYARSYATRIVVKAGRELAMERKLTVQDIMDAWVRTPKGLELNHNYFKNQDRDIKRPEPEHSREHKHSIGR
jgi:hypothetical protein